MGYVYASYYINGNTSNCTSGTLWLPGQGRSIDYNDGKRSDISYIYLSNFGRYAEQGGLESWLVEYVVNSRSYSYMNTLIRNSASGYDVTARNGARHIMIGAGGCPPPIIYGCRDPQADNYNASATADATCTYSAASVSLTASPTSLILEDGGTYTLTWSISSKSTIYSRQLYLNGSFNRTITSNSGSLTLSPSTGTDLTYQLRVTNKAGVSYSPNRTITVYERPVVTLSVDRPTIVQGESANLSWTTSGDATTMNITPGIGPSNLSSTVSISPTITTTYTATASGNGGTGSDSLTVTVLPRPIVNVYADITIDYGSTPEFYYDATNVPESFTVTPHYYDLDGVETIGSPISLETGDSVDGDDILDNIPWGNRGPSIIELRALGVGYGELTDTDNHLISVDIDRMPNLINIPESRDKLKQEDVTSPEEESLLVLEVTDIDIPVEVKADLPAQVQINDDKIWRNVEQI